MADGRLYRLAAFTREPSGGNPAGVWIGDALPPEDEMQRIAADVGYSETAFVAPASGLARTVRYYSPEAEVPFCGHATIAAGVQLAASDGAGDFLLESRVGSIPVAVTRRDGVTEAALTSVRPEHRPAPGDVLDEALAALGWQRDEIDDAIPPALAFAGAWHLVIAARSRQRLGNLDYDFARLKALMLAQGLTTVQLVWRESPDLFHSRNPFPVGGVVEDPATGAAAAALGGYLRDSGRIDAPVEITVRQGDDMGRPGRIRVTVPRSGGIVVGGAAVAIPANA